MSEVLDAACEKSGDTDQPKLAREAIRRTNYRSGKTW
jgi:hypothetical protein